MNRDSVATVESSVDFAHDLPSPLSAPRRGLTLPGFGRMALYSSGEAPSGANADATPLLLVHSVNATASALEMSPAFERQKLRRPVIALELPGFAASAHPDTRYTPALMRDAIGAAIEWTRRHVADAPVDVMALSLACEFATLAALQRPSDVRTMTLISPTGMESRRASEPYEPGRSREMKWLRRVLRNGAVGASIYTLLTTHLSMRWFLSRSWGTSNFDPHLLEYGRLCAQQADARHAPMDFVSGALFTPGIIELYRRLPMPVWVAHGKRGSFTDFGACPQRAGGAAAGSSMPVTLTRFESGSMPHYQQPDLFDTAYERFLAACSHPRAPAAAAAVMQTVGVVSVGSR